LQHDHHQIRVILGGIRVGAKADVVVSGDAGPCIIDL
jgi:hypothetical protein